MTTTAVRAEPPPSSTIRPVVQRAHRGELAAYAVSDDGDWLASAGSDATVQVWHLPTGLLAHAFAEPSVTAHTIDFDDENRRLVAANTNQVWVWSLSSGALLTRLTMPSIRDVWFLDENMVMIVGREHLQLLDAERGTVSTPHCTGPLVFSPSRTLSVRRELVEGTDATRIALESVSAALARAGSEQASRTLDVEGRARHIAFSRDEARFLVVTTSMAGDATATIFATDDLEPLRTVPLPDGEIEQIALIGETVVAEMERWPEPAPDDPADGGETSDGDLLAKAETSEESGVRRWLSTDGTHLRDLSPSEEVDLETVPGRLVLRDDDGGVVQEIDPLTGRADEVELGMPVAVDLRSGRRIAARDGQGLWVEDARGVMRLGHPGDPVTRLDLGPDGRYLVAIDTAGATVIDTHAGGTAFSVEASRAWSDDGELLWIDDASSTLRSRAFSAPTSTVRFEVPPDLEWVLYGDGHLLRTSDFKTIERVDATSGEVVWTHTLPRPTTVLGYLPTLASVLVREGIVGAPILFDLSQAEPTPRKLEMQREFGRALGAPGVVLFVDRGGQIHRVTGDEVIPLPRFDAPPLSRVPMNPCGVPTVQPGRPTLLTSAMAAGEDSFVIGESGGDATLRAADDGEILAALPHEGTPNHAAHDADSGMWATATSRHLYIWTPDGEPVETHSMPARVTAMRALDDGRVALGFADGATMLFELATGEWQLFTAGREALEGEWLWITHDGYFAGSPDADRLLAMVVDGRPYGLAQFAHVANRPDIVLQRLGSPQRARIAYYRRLNRWRQRRLEGRESPANASRQERETADGDREATSALAVGYETDVPRVQILSTDQRGRSVTMRARLEDTTTSLSHYQVFVNGVPLYSSPGRTLPAGIHTHEVAPTFDLLPGHNEIEISAVNVDGLESWRARRVASYDPEEPTPSETTGGVGDLVVVSLGVSDYADDALDLGYAARDASDLVKLFAQTARKTSSASARRVPAFDAVRVVSLTDAEVTASALGRVGETLDDTTVDDTVVLHIAGHGVHDERGHYYFLTHETSLADLSGTAVRFRDIEGLLDGIPARRKLFLMDTCESGELRPEVQVAREDAAREHGAVARTVSPERARAALLSTGQEPTIDRSFLLERDRYIYNSLTRRAGAIVLSSSRGGELSYESDAFENGYFTEAVLRALSRDAARADENADGVVDDRELRAFVAATVAEMSDGLQNPVVDRDNRALRIALPTVGDLDPDALPEMSLPQGVRVGGRVPGHVERQPGPCACGLIRSSRDSPAVPWSLAVTLVAIAFVRRLGRARGSQTGRAHRVTPGFASAGAARTRRD